MSFQQEVQQRFDALQDSSWTVLDASKSIAELQTQVSCYKILSPSMHMSAEHYVSLKSALQQMPIQPPLQLIHKGLTVSMQLHGTCWTLPAVLDSL